MGTARRTCITLMRLAVFGDHYLTKALARKENNVREGKSRSLEVITIAFMVSAAGDREDPVVIWTSERPRYFRGIEISSLPVKYFHQSKAWMTGNTLNKILSTFNSKMIQQKRSIVLLMDNAGCHPQDIKEKYSNIKFVFLPPNTTSKLQPLDLGIIANFKTHYRRLLLCFVLASIDTCNSASEVVRSVTILTAIRWISKAWMEVKAETVS